MSEFALLVMGLFTLGISVFLLTVGNLLGAVFIFPFAVLALWVSLDPRITGDGWDASGWLWD